MTTLNYLLHGEKESIGLESSASKNLLGCRTGWFLGEELVFGSWVIFFEKHHRTTNIVIVFVDLSRIQGFKLFSLAQELHKCAVELLLNRSTHLWRTFGCVGSPVGVIALPWECLSCQYIRCLHSLGRIYSDKVSCWENSNFQGSPGVL